MAPVAFSPQLASVIDIEHSDAATAKAAGAKHVAPTTNTVATEKLFMPSFAAAVGYRTLMNRIQHDHRYLALGLELIVGVGRPKFERLFPKSEAFLARRYPGPRVQLLSPDLYLDVGVRENILIPPWVLGRASL